MLVGILNFIALIDQQLFARFFILYSVIVLYLLVPCFRQCEPGLCGGFNLYFAPVSKAFSGLWVL